MAEWMGWLGWFAGVATGFWIGRIWEWFYIRRGLRKKTIPLRDLL